MKKIFCIAFVIALIAIMGVGCGKQKDRTKTTKKTEKSSQNESANTETATAQHTDGFVPSTNSVESSHPLSGETYTLYYFVADASNVGIAAFKNSEQQSMEDRWIEEYNLKAYTQSGNYEIIIPETIDGKTVCNIDMNAFNNCNSIISVTIPASCTKIEAGVFLRGCREDIIIYGTKGSAAETHAQEYGLTFCEIQ